MRPLQDRCYPTAYEDIEALFLEDIGKPVSELFEEFDPKPLGVASLAQVHRAKDRATGLPVAVKLQHPHLQEFCDVDMKTVEVSLGECGLAPIDPSLTYLFLRSHQAMVPGFRVYLAGRGDARKPAEGDELHD